MSCGCLRCIDPEQAMTCGNCGTKYTHNEPHGFLVCLTIMKARLAAAERVVEAVRAQITECNYGVHGPRSWSTIPDPELLCATFDALAAYDDKVGK